MRILTKVNLFCFNMKDFNSYNKDVKGYFIGEHLILLEIL